MIELYAKLKKYKSYKRHPCSLFRILRKLGYFQKEENKKKKYIPKKYHTPENIGEKWQLDVKYIPAKCYVGEIPDRFYQYTMIDEASREKFIYPFKEQSSYSTIEFVKMAIKYFKYKPKIIQTDNGFEFTYFKETKRTHPFDIFCANSEIEEKNSWSLTSNYYTKLVLFSLKKKSHIIYKYTSQNFNSVAHTI